MLDRNNTPGCERASVPRPVDLIDHRNGRITGPYEIGVQTMAQPLWHSAIRSSQGLRCKPEGESCSSIHRAYNRWVVQLRSDIEYGVQTVRLEDLRENTAVGAQ